MNKTAGQSEKALVKSYQSESVPIEKRKNKKEKMHKKLNVTSKNGKLRKQVVHDNFITGLVLMLINERVSIFV